jgi:glutamate transport system permease protein
MRTVILPQAVRLVVPTLVTQLVALLKDSTLGYVVSYPELMKQGNNLTVYTHLLIQTYLIVAAIYVVVNVALSRLAVWLERRLGTRVRRNAARAEPAGAAPPTMA